jgi:hypothetical protein
MSNRNPDRDAIFVKSHVARDLLQSAGLFKTDKLVVWEYVSNGLQYVDPGTSPVVHVALDSKARSITVSDNGRGMTWSDLRNFFVMHGVNIDRKMGRSGRGRFGTGKSAAFGIADVLRVRTTRDGLRTIVELKRSDIDAMGSEDPIPVKVIAREVTTNEPNGTIVEIAQVNLRSLDQQGVIHYIERHLARWSKGVRVYVNNHECEYAEPPVAVEQHVFPVEESRDVIGDVELILKTAKAPIDEDLRGIAIYSNGVWLETTLAGSEGREMSQYIFGEIDVPRLDDERTAIPSFDISRSMRLNPNNETVRALYGFISVHVEEVRRALVEEERTRKATAEARRLREQARGIEKVLNEDFDEFRNRVARAKARQPGSRDLRAVVAGTDGQDLLFGSDESAVIVSPTGDLGHGDGDGGEGGGEPRNLDPVVEASDESAPRLGKHSGGKRDRRGRGEGFR